MEIRRRYVPDQDFDDNLPYGGKVVLAKKKKPESWFVTSIEVTEFLV